jgi:3-methyl-2-oxobutanoate hydroxymethyltransferase
MIKAITLSALHCHQNSLFLTSNKSKYMSIAKKEYKRVTVKSLVDMKRNGEKISMLTAYDYSMAKIVDAANVDVILVGDSASNVMAGHETTLPITLDQMIYHASSVIRAIDRALVVVDLPFGSYQSDPKEALRSAIRIMKESGAHAVKVEGGAEIKESVKRILAAGIPVMGHLGLTPQSIYKFGTYTVRAKEDVEAEKLKEDALLLEKLGCFGIVLEKIPANLTKEVSESLTIPTIGIGGGKHADGQVLVIHDLLGMTHEFNPRFLRRYMNLYEEMGKAIAGYVADVKSMDFPNDEEQY